MRLRGFDAIVRVGLAEQKTHTANMRGVEYTDRCNTNRGTAHPNIDAFFTSNGYSSGLVFI